MIGKLEIELMEFRTLEHFSLSEITCAFNLAFSDYMIPLKLTEDAMAEKIQTENILPTLSAGIFDNGQLVGFILHGYDLINGVKTVYNAGTGVIPAYRGKGLTESIYNYIIPKLQSLDIRQHILEVISTNKPALRVYEKTGFHKKRELGVFKKTGIGQNDTTVLIKEIEPEQTLLYKFASCEPSWQNTTASILRNSNGHQMIAAYEKEEILGFAIYVPTTGRVKQLAVNPQQTRRGIGTALVSYLMNHIKSDALVFTNVDLNYWPAIHFFQHLGFERILMQYEMSLST